MKKGINDFLDTFKFKGKEYEVHIQILLMQILKCFQQNENSFKFLCNIENEPENTFINFDQIELDFAINDLDNALFKKIIYYLEKNILLLNFRGNIYEIKKGRRINHDIFEFEKEEKIDIIGEIGINAIFDKQKIEQFKMYEKILN